MAYDVAYQEFAESSVGSPGGVDSCGVSKRDLNLHMQSDYMRHERPNTPISRLMKVYSVLG